MRKSREKPAKSDAIEIAPTEGATPLKVLVEMPRHGMADSALDYLADRAWPPGTLVRVPLGRRVVTGIVWGAGDAEVPADVLRRPIAEALAALPALDAGWRALVGFAASYYQRALGELALTVLPGELRDLDGIQLERRLKRLRRGLDEPAVAPPTPAALDTAAPPLSPEQSAVLAALAAQPAATTLLFGATGSGKTEVYLREAARVLAEGRQVLVLVPEINLTPQLEARFAARFPARRLVSLHSGLTPPQRLQHWLAAHLGQADLVLGTRMAIFASMPRLGLIVVDEEHDPSYKQQEGARYSARDLAVVRARQLGIGVLLGSATPSLETWHNARAAAAPVAGETAAGIDKASITEAGAGRYRRLDMPSRIGGGELPRVRILDLKQVAAKHGTQALRESPLAPELLEALQQRLAAGEQSLVLLNRRGYAPVLHCTECGWKSDCAHCSAHRVFHKIDRTLRCHHCGFTERVPRACPTCGNQDIAPVGRGTERLEEQLAALLPGARVGRIDADTTRLKGSLETQLASVHAGDIDVLVGTQMVAKGHDFRRITLVAAVNADAALFSSDFRASERLFALLMQAGGRAGRDAEQAARSQMWVQTWFAEHPLYAALKRHDFPAFAASVLAERRSAGLPPFTHLALVRAEARQFETAVAFLADAGETAAEAGAASAVTLYPPVPTPVQRVADVERAQMLVESASRPALQRFLSDWVPQLHALKSRHKRLMRWAVDVDPAAI